MSAEKAHSLSQFAGGKGSFQYDETAGSCHCPIHRGESRPFTAPLGYRFAGDVEARQIPESTAKAVYEAHHSYMSGSDMHPSNICHYGIFYQNQLMGAVTIRAPLGRRRLDWDSEGNIIPRPAGELDLPSLPNPISDRAQQFIDPPAEEEIASSAVLGGTEIMELNRICIGVDMPNLASAGVARCQERFVQSDRCPEDIRYYMTMVRADFDASMIRALRGKGWTLRSVSTPSEPGNRPSKDIHDEYKWVWVCPATPAHRQEALTDYTPAKTATSD
jgi:hypothetical protein